MAGRGGRGRGRGRGGASSTNGGEFDAADWDDDDGPEAYTPRGPLVPMLFPVCCCKPQSLALG
jgi:hypothetical protein